MYYHIIDHNGFGTMHKVIMALCRHSDKHKMISYIDVKKIKKSIESDHNPHIIIHSTASKKSHFIYDFHKHFGNKKVYIFMHVSVEYELYKDRGDVIEYLKELTDNHNVEILTPSPEVTNQYIDHGIKAKTIQLGIEMENVDSYFKYNSSLSPYYGKIITTCSSDNDEYKYIKGIDLYEKFIINNNLVDVSLIAGTDNNRNSKLLCKRFSENEFLNILAHSLMYVQFSRYESYNLTASYAKRFKIPVFVLNTEGVRTCMNGVVYDDYNSLTAAVLSTIAHGKQKELIEKMYEESLIRESIENFDDSFVKKIGRV